MRRETIITTVLDARPLQVIRLGTPSVKPMMTAVALGGVFILTTYHLYIWSAVSGVATLACVLWWLWTGTAEIPEKPTKHDRPRHRACRSISRARRRRAGGRCSSR